MVLNVIMPNLSDMGFEMKTGVIVKWLKKEGDRVEKDEPLYILETMKVTTEIRSPASGILKKIMAPEGSEVPILETIAIIE